MELHLSQIVVEKDRGRKIFKGLPELMESIKKHGILHPPVVAPREDGKYRLIAGERRYRASCLLGLEKIPVNLREDLTELQQKEIELEENIARENLTWQEQIELYRQIDELKRKIHGEKMQGDSKGEGWTTQKTAELLDIDRSHLSKQIKFAKLLRDKPQLKEKLEGLPLTIAMRKAKMILDAEKAERVQENVDTNYKLLLGDSLTLIKTVENDSIGLLLTDIPYGLEAINKGSSGNYKGLVKGEENSTLDKTEELMSNLIPELFRVLKPSAHFYIFHSIDQYHFLRRILEEVGFLVDPNPIVWDKQRTTAPFRGYSYAPCYELCLFGHKPPREKMLVKACKSLVQSKTTKIGDKVHVFQKPIDLLQYFILQSSNTGDVVLDPFAGSGSTIVAANKLNRKAIGFELDKENYNNAKAFISNSEKADDELAKEVG
jgi:site-specific DNA-methyltransferase (adenine-specific)